jgi:hypothetical protein
MESQEELKELAELIKSPVKNIKRLGDKTIIEFANGFELPLEGKFIEINYKVPTCNFCGLPALDDPLYSPDDKNYICKHCATLAVETFLKNNVEIGLKIPGFGVDQLQKMAHNINGVKDTKNDGENK